MNEIPAISITKISHTKSIYLKDFQSVIEDYLESKSFIETYKHCGCLGKAVHPGILQVYYSSTATLFKCP